jgi:VRR-NUC domain-containing protein
VSLGIALTVRRCKHPEHQRGRVRFLLGKRCRPGEAVVLRRWRDRSREPAAVAKGVTFDGCRLPPGTFQLLDACREAGSRLDAPVTPEILRPFYERARREHPTWRAPNPTHLAAMMTCLARTNRLAAIVDRERRAANPGLPDLFLWKRDRYGVPFGGTFIEVKRRQRNRREPTSIEQDEEIAFLKRLGARARILYLDER